MRYHIISTIEDDTYDLLTEEEFDAQSDDFWEEWNSLAFEVDLGRLRLACKKRKITSRGTVIPFSSGSGFNNFWYET